MTCSNNITPCGCGNNPCGCGTSSDDVVYQGPNLSCTGVSNCDTLTQVIETIDGFICGPEMVQTIINNIINNTNLYNQFTTIVNNTVDCQTVWDCSTSTTTTSTTIAPTCYCVEVIIDQDDLDAALGNTNPALNNKLYLSGYLGSACDGGDLDRTYTVEDAYKFCVAIASIPSLALYYYKDDDIVTGGSLSSLVINLAEDCSVTGDCFDPTTTTTTTTVGIICNFYTLNNLDDFDTTYSYLDCEGLLVEDVFIDAFGTVNFCAQADSVNFNSEIIDEGICPTTTTTTTIPL